MAKTSFAVLEIGSEFEAQETAANSNEHEAQHQAHPVQQQQYSPERLELEEIKRRQAMEQQPQL